MFSQLLSQADETVWPSVRVGLNILPQGKVLRAVVDTNLHQPSMFEVTLLDDDGLIAQKERLTIGADVRITAKAAGTLLPKLLIDGEITSVEAVCEDLQIFTIIRGFEKSHRLQHARRTRVFSNVTDADIAREIALDAGLIAAEVMPTLVVHKHMPQVNQTDWDFLRQRAREIGFETGVSKGFFYFRKASGAASLTALSLTFKQNLLAFRPSVNAANLTSRVEVRAWDQESAEPLVATSVVNSQTALLPGAPPALLATASAGFKLPTPPRPTHRMSMMFGLPPDPNAYVINNHPLGEGTAFDPMSAHAMASSLAEHIGSTFAEAEGQAVGHPDIQAGQAVQVAGVPLQFTGLWTVTQARHVFDADEGGYRTHFCVSGRQDRSLLGLTSMGGSQGAPPRINGLVCGIVTDNGEPQVPAPPSTPGAVTGRVKVTLPWLAPDYVTNWARVVQFGAGQDGGSFFLPEVGDEVLVGFEFGDVRRPYVIGGLVNNKTSYHTAGLGGPAMTSPVAGTVLRRGFVTPTGNRLTFLDQTAPGGEGPSLQSAVVLGTAKENMSLAIDQKLGTITLSCKPQPPESTPPSGTITIECGQGGKININAGPGGSVSIDGGNSLELKATKISLNALNSIELSAPQSIAAKSASIDLGA